MHPPTLKELLKIFCNSNSKVTLQMRKLALHIKATSKICSSTFWASRVPTLFVARLTSLRQKNNKKVFTSLKKPPWGRFIACVSRIGEQYETRYSEERSLKFLPLWRFMSWLMLVSSKSICTKQSIVSSVAHALRECKCKIKHPGKDFAYYGKRTTSWSGKQKCNCLSKLSL